jgi:hypothetical protein
MSLNQVSVDNIKKIAQIVDDRIKEIRKKYIGTRGSKEIQRLLTIPNADPYRQIVDIHITHCINTNVELDNRNGHSECFKSHNFSQSCSAALTFLTYLQKKTSEIAVSELNLLANVSIGERANIHLALLDRIVGKFENNLIKLPEGDLLLLLSKTYPLIYQNELKSLPISIIKRLNGKRIVGHLTICWTPIVLNNMIFVVSLPRKYLEDLATAKAQQLLPVWN